MMLYVPCLGNWFRLHLVNRVRRRFGLGHDHMGNHLQRTVCVYYIVNTVFKLGHDLRADVGL